MSVFLFRQGLISSRLIDSFIVKPRNIGRYSYVLGPYHPESLDSRPEPRGPKVELLFRPIILLQN